MRALVTYVETYRVTDDGHGGSVDVDNDTREDVETFETLSGDGWHETAARQAAESLCRAGLTYGADGGDWFGTPEPYSHPHEDSEERTTAHFRGDWTETERRAVIRMARFLADWRPRNMPH